MTYLENSPFPTSVSLAADLLGIEEGEAQAALLYLAADIAVTNRPGKASDSEDDKNSEPMKTRPRN